MSKKLTAKECIYEFITAIIAAYYTSCWWIMINWETITIENEFLKGSLALLMVISLAVGTGAIISFAAITLYRIYQELD